MKSSRNACSLLSLVFFFFVSSFHEHDAMCDAAAVAALATRRPPPSEVAIVMVGTSSKGAATTPSSVQRTRGGSSMAAAAAAEAGSEAWVVVQAVVGIASVVSAVLNRWVCVGENQIHTMKLLVAGAVAGMVSKTVVSPLEVVSTLQMVSGNSKPLVVELQSLLRKEGMAGFFKGNLANCLKVAPTRGIQFVCFEAFKKKIMDYRIQVKQQQQQQQNLSQDDEEIGPITLTPLERLIAGGAAGMVASSLVYPLEVVKTFLTIGNYPSLSAAFRAVISTTGVRGLYKGLQPTLLAMFPYVGVEFMIYETGKLALQKQYASVSRENNNNHANEQSAASLPIWVSLGLGAVAGAAAQTAAHPLDVVRKRLQIQGFTNHHQQKIMYRNLSHCFMCIAQTEGMRALYKGLRPACVATIPGTGIAYIVYEFMKQRVLGLNEETTDKNNDASA
jgi:hypothetical protein